MHPDLSDVRRLLALVLVMVAVGCGDDDGGTGPGVDSTEVVRPTLTVVSGSGATDTVDAPLAAIVVELRGPGGEAFRDVVVRFEAQPPADTNYRHAAAVHLCPITTGCVVSEATPAISRFMVDTTDVDGRAQAAVRLGSVLGRAVVHVNVLEFGLRDSAVFTVTPGAPSVLRVQISSTVLDIGSTASLTATVHDRHGNLRPEVPTFSAGPGTAVTVDPVTGVVSAVGLGVQSVNAEYGTLRSSVTVRAAPAARLVVWNAIGADVRLINLNGAQPRTLRTSVASRLGTYPRFDPSRQSVTLHTATSGSISGTPDMVLVLDTLGVLQRSIGPDLTGFSTVIATRPIADGSILAVARRTTDAVGAFSLYRISSDNLVTPVVQLPQMGENYCGADISPDGSSVAYLASVAGKLELRIFTVSSGSFVAVEPDARCPRWSPQGDQLAFLVHLPSHSTLDGNLAVMNADGNGRRLLGDAVYAPGLAWSPDAKYLIGRPASSTFRLTRVSDAATMVFQLPADYYQPDWIK